MTTMYHPEKATPTFTTRNRSRKKFYTLLLAGTFVALMVAIIILYRRDRMQRMYRDIELGTRGKYNFGGGGGSQQSASSPGRGNGGGGRPAGGMNDDSGRRTSPEDRYYAAESIAAEVITLLPQNGGAPLKGQVHRRADGRNVVSYLGVPYAYPPTNELRFEPPKLIVANWTKIAEAFYQPPRCPQSSTLSSINELRQAERLHTSEDCLYLNLWTPLKAAGPNEHIPASKLRPVVVYLHSGIFGFGHIGSPDLDGSNLTALADVVTVTVQYRLGAQGFIAFPTDTAKDDFVSFGLQDQLKALEWVQKNIKAFGGDPERITVAGHGAGAVSIGLHLMSSPMAAKTMRRVIAQGIDNVWNRGLYGLTPRSSEFFLDDLGCDLKNVDRDHLKKCVLKLKINMPSMIETQQFQIEKYPVPFGPQVNPYTRDVAKAIEEDATTDLWKLFGKWKVFPKDTDFLIGLNSDDDYQLDRINKDTSAVSFDEDEIEEEEEEEEEEVDTSDTSDSSSSTTAAPSSNDNNNNEDEVEEIGETESEDTEGEKVEGGGLVATSNKTEVENNVDKKKSEDLKLEPEENVDEAEEGDSEAEEEVTVATVAPTTTTVSSANTNSTSKDKRQTVAPTTVDNFDEGAVPAGMIVRRRRKRRQVSATTTTTTTDAAAIKFEPQETIKFCRLVNMWRQHRKEAMAESGKPLTSKVFLYRIEPKVLLNLHEEVSMAFGARQNWLENFSANLRKLWGSFIVSGNLASVDSKLVAYDSKLNDLDADMVNIVQLGQDSSERFGTVQIMPVSIKATCEGVTW